MSGEAYQKKLKDKCALGRWDIMFNPKVKKWKAAFNGVFL
jgi:hypothetical protein